MGPSSEFLFLVWPFHFKLGWWNNVYVDRVRVIDAFHSCISWSLLQYMCRRYVEIFYGNFNIPNYNNNVNESSWIPKNFMEPQTFKGLRNAQGRHAAIGGMQFFREVMPGNDLVPNAEVLKHWGREVSTTGEPSSTHCSRWCRIWCDGHCGEEGIRAKDGEGMPRSANWWQQKSLVLP